MRKLSYILTCFIYSGIAWGNCTDIDLNAGANSPLNKIPITDQDGTETCYGQTAALLLNYEHLKAGGTLDKGVHPLHVAWQGKKLLTNDKYVSKGIVIDVLHMVQGFGYCPANIVSENLRQLKIGDAKGLTDAELLYIIELLYSDDKYSYESPANRAKRLKLKKIDNSPMVEDCQIDSVASALAVRSMLKIPATQILTTLFSGCSKQTFSNLNAVKKAKGSDKDMIGYLDHALNKNKPAAISICPNFFDNYQYKLKGVGTDVVRDANINRPDDCHGHSVAVTARKSSGGVCKYLIRNSWGAKWNNKGNSRCACILNTGEYNDICTDPKQVKEYVGCWFTHDVVARNLMEVTHLD